jgi:hypothetical protein
MFNFRKGLEAKEVVITGLQDDIQKLLLETKENRLVIAKQVKEIEELRRQRSHASTMDDIQNPTDDETHVHDTNMLVENDVIENVVATVTVGVFEDIHSSICRRHFSPRRMMCTFHLSPQVRFQIHHVKTRSFNFEATTNLLENTSPSLVSSTTNGRLLASLE